MCLSSFYLFLLPHPTFHFFLLLPPSLPWRGKEREREKWSVSRLGRKKKPQHNTSYNLSYKNGFMCPLRASYNFWSKYDACSEKVFRSRAWQTEPSLRLRLLRQRVTSSTPPFYARLKTQHGASSLIFITIIPWTFYQITSFFFFISFIHPISPPSGV